MAATHATDPVGNASPVQRAAFIRKTYIILAVALLAFIGIEALAVQFGVLDSFNELGLGEMVERVSNRSTAVGHAGLRRGPGRMMIGLFAVALMLMSVPALIADWWGKSVLPRTFHYAGIAFYLLVDAIVFAPVLLVLMALGSTQALITVAVMTLFLSLGALAVVAFADTDYSPVKLIFCLAGSVMLGMLATTAFFSASGVVIIFGLMQFYAVGALVLRTLQLMREAEPAQHVGAALSLLASMPLFLPMFFMYLIRFTAPGMKDLSEANGEFSTSSRYREQGITADEEHSRRREKEFAEYVERQMARGRKM